MTKQAGAFIVVYGPSKAGKTTACGAAAAAGLFIAQAGALTPVRRFLGAENLQEHRAKSVMEATTILEKEGKKHPIICVDDFSLLVEQTIRDLESKYSFGDMWRRLRTQVLGMRDAARELTESGIHVIFNAHEQPQRTSSVKYVRGGPALPGQLPEQFSAFADVVARAVFDETAAPWKYVFHTGPNGQWISGDRLSVFPDESPMNIAEGLREAGFPCPRPKGLEWQEKVAEVGAQAVLDAGLEDWRAPLREIADKINGAKPPAHVRWALQDALHRAILRSAQQGVVEDFFAGEGEDW